MYFNKKKIKNNYNYTFKYYLDSIYIVILSS